MLSRARTASFTSRTRAASTAPSSTASGSSSAELADGDELQIGKYRLTFLGDERRPPAAPTRDGLLTIGDGLPAPAGRVPRHLDLEDPLPRGPGPARPQRTQGGYRLFGEDDVERLETILRLQRDEFLPLRVIREELATPGATERKRRRPAGLGERIERDRPRRALPARRDHAEQARELEDFGLLVGARRRAASKRYAETDADIAVVCAQLTQLRRRRRGTCGVPDRSRPRGGAARAARGAGAALRATPSAARPASATCSRSPSSRRSWLAAPVARGAVEVGEQVSPAAGRRLDLRAR